MSIKEALIGVFSDDPINWLKWGIVFSIFWIAGIGSIWAVLSGLTANRAINSSNGTLVGKGKALWCIIVGAIGLILWVPILIIGFVNQF